MTVKMEDIVNLAKNRGFVYAGSEIYGGLANTWDYGPYGSILKDNIRNLWLKEFVQKRTDMVQLDAGILMNPQVWVASGHVGGFSDPLVDCKSCNQRFRADKIMEENILLNPDWLEINTIIKELDFHLMWIFVKAWFSENKLFDENDLDFSEINELVDDYWNPSIWWKEDLNQEIKSKFKEKNLCYTWKNLNQKINYYFQNLKTLKCPNCWAHDWTDIRNFNLMFRTSQGVTEDSSATIYMRPETAQGIFVNFANIARTSRKRIPFGVAQVGKAFRNEITPGNFIFRTREFEQMEIEYFCEPETSMEHHALWKQACYDFLIQKIGLKEDSLKKRDHDADELSHYSSATTDIEFKFPFGWGELWGIAHRGDFDLKAHMSESKQDLSYFDPVNNKKYIPHVIEPSVGLTRLFLATLSDAYTVEGEGEETRTYLKLDPKVAPIKVGILPIVKKLSEEARKIYAELSENFVCEYDETGSVGKRYARMDEIGTPFCITIDSENYDAGNVTLRHRDSMQQEVIAISNLANYIRERLR